jgi:hypothetical protein
MLNLSLRLGFARRRTHRLRTLAPSERHEDKGANKKVKTGTTNMNNNKATASLPPIKLGITPKPV